LNCNAPQRPTPTPHNAQEDSAEPYTSVRVVVLLSHSSKADWLRVRFAGSIEFFTLWDANTHVRLVVKKSLQLAGRG
jgi:hypothetical protein